MRIAKNYKRPEERIPAERDRTMFVVLPVTGELIPISEMEERMHISLIDPKCKEQKERMLAKFRRPPLHLMMRFQGALLVLLALALIFLGPPRRRFLMLLRQKLKRKGMSSRSRLFGMVIPVALVGLPLMHCLSLRVVRNSLMFQMLMFLVQLRFSGVACNCPDLLSHFLLLMFLALLSLQHRILSHHQVLMPGVPHMMPHMHPPPQQITGQPQMIRMPGQMVHMPTNIPPPPGQTQFMPGPPRSFPMPPPPHMPPMVNSIGIPQPPAPPLPPQPPAEEQPPPPDEPEPKRLRADDASLIPAEQFLTQHPVMALASLLYMLF